jgi:hypothetical protein
MSKRELVHRLLLEAGERGVTTAQLMAAGAGSRYGGRIFELRSQGLVIETERIREGAYRYTLRRPPEPRPVPPVRIDSLEVLPLFELAPPAPLNAALTDWEAA